MRYFRAYKNFSGTANDLDLFDAAGNTPALVEGSSYVITTVWANDSAAGDLYVWIDADADNSADDANIIYRYKNPANGGFSHLFGQDSYSGWRSKEMASGVSAMPIVGTGASGTINAGVVGYIVDP